MSRAEGSATTNGDRLAAADIAQALTRAAFSYNDGATQVFTPDGRTIYTENGSPTSGEWGVDDQGRFWSFWPPNYRATYELYWLTDAVDQVVGIRFSELDRGSTFEGRYVPALG